MPVSSALHWITGYGFHEDGLKVLDCSFVFFAFLFPCTTYVGYFISFDLWYNFLIDRARRLEKLQLNVCSGRKVAFL
jgi:hypothetical protein